MHFSDEPCIDVPITSEGGLDMLIAQGLVEYGALAGGSSSRLGEVLGNLEYTIERAGPSTWIMVSAGLLAVWFLFFRK